MTDYKTDVFIKKAVFDNLLIKVITLDELIEEIQNVIDNPFIYRVIEKEKVLTAQDYYKQIIGDIDQFKEQDEILDLEEIRERLKHNAVRYEERLNFYVNAYKQGQDWIRQTGAGRLVWDYLASL